MKLGFAFLCLGALMGSGASSSLASFQNDVIIPHRLLADEAPNCTCVNETVVVCEEDDHHDDENVTVAEARSGHTMGDNHTDHEEEKHWEDICVCVAGVLDCEDDDHAQHGEDGCHCHDGEVHCDDPELEADCHCHGDEPHCDDHSDEMTKAPSAAPSAIAGSVSVVAVMLAATALM